LYNEVQNNFSRIPADERTYKELKRRAVDHFDWSRQDEAKNKIYIKSIAKIFTIQFKFDKEWRLAKMLHLWR